ncbi:MAG: tetratricopeptide repeat protein [Candidatus Zhuqueibacterota bacterium]
MSLFLDILMELVPEMLFRAIKDYIDIRKGELKDSAFEKFYRTLVVSFIDTQKGLDQGQAKKFFASDAALDGVLAYLYRFTDPDAAIRDKCQQALCSLADRYKISGDAKFPTEKLVQRFLVDLETELRHDVNKSLLPFFTDLRDDHARIVQKLDSLTEQIEADRQAREQRATQIDASGEKVTVHGQLIYDSREKPEPQLPLPVIHCTLEAIDKDNDRYRSVITNDKGKELHKHNFTLKRDDVFLLNANHWLEHDGLQDYRSQIKIDSNRTFTQRVGNHYFELIMGGNGTLKKHLNTNGELERGFQFMLELDPEAELLWQAPWEFLHDSEEFLGLSGKVHLVRTPLGAGALAVKPIPQPLRILVVISNPADKGEFDGERALSSIQEAVDYARRNGWVELEYLEDATFLNFQQRLAAFQPHVVHYIGHGGRNPDDKKSIKSPYSGMPGETYLAFENENGDLDPLYGKHLQQLLANASSVQLLVLSGCMTGQTAATDALAGVGTALLREQLPALVVMQYSVLVDTAIQFAKIFYERISSGKRLSQALTEVRQVLAKGREHRADWGIPALYLRSAELQLIDPRAKKREPEITVERTAIGDLPVVAGFVGRVKELRRLRETVKHPQQPVIYIWGLGGIGKTSLTAKLIEKLEQEHAIDARRVIRCNEIEPTFAAIAQKVGDFIKLQGMAGHAEAGIMLQDSRYDIETRVSLLNQVIKDRRCLFVFDNFESLFSEKIPQVGRLNDPELETFFQTLFSHNWRSTFLFTCRYQWNLLLEEPGMHRYACGLPRANALVLQLQGLSPAQTRMLMKNLPALGKLTFIEQTQVLPLVLGHPHTVHLFDAYLGQYGLKSVLQDDEITRRRDVTCNVSTPTEIIQNLGAYFLDGLWAKLNEQERDILGLLSVFRTSLAEDGLRQLAPDLAALTTLRNYSLVQRMTSDTETRPDYGVHPVVRGYVDRKFSAEQMKAYHMAAVDFYVAQQAARFPKSDKIDQWTPALLAQIAELAAQQGNTPLALSLTEGLLEMHHHLFAAGEYEQAGALVTDFYDFLAMIGRREVAKNLLRQSIASREGFNKYVAMGNLATLLKNEGKWQEALATHQECIDYFDKEDAKQQMAQVLSQQAQIYQERGEYEQALELERKAIEIKEEIKDETVVIQYYRIAQLLDRMERYDEALTAGETALAKVRQISNAQLEAACLHQLGMTLNKLNRPQQAFERFQESLQITERLGDRAGQADTLGEMGKLLLNTGQFDAAIHLFQKAIEIYFEQNNPVKAAIVLEAIGFTFEQQGHFQEALEKYQEALRLFKQYSHAGDVAGTERNIARVKAKLGR